MADIFEEVDEELRRDDYLALWKTYGPWVVGGALLIIGGTAGYQGWSAMHNASLSRASDAFMSAQSDFEAERLPLAAAGFDTLIEDGSAGYVTLGLMQRGAVALEAGETEAAAEFFEQVAARAGDPILRDLAVLKSIWARWDNLSAADVEIRLRPLAEDTAPFRFLARETIAAAHLRAEDYDRARTEYQFLSFNFETPQGVARRSQEALALIDQRAPQVAEEAPTETDGEAAPTEGDGEAASTDVDAPAPAENAGEDTAEDAEGSGND